MPDATSKNIASAFLTNSKGHNMHDPITSHVTTRIGQWRKNPRYFIRHFWPMAKHEICAIQSQSWTQKCVQSKWVTQLSYPIKGPEMTADDHFVRTNLGSQKYKRPTLRLPPQFIIQIQLSILRRVLPAPSPKPGHNRWSKLPLTWNQSFPNWKSLAIRTEIAKPKWQVIQDIVTKVS